MFLLYFDVIQFDFLSFEKIFNENVDDKSIFSPMRHNTEVIGARYGEKRQQSTKLINNEISVKCLFCVYAIELKLNSHYRICLTFCDDEDDDDFSVDTHFCHGQIFQLHFIPKMFYSFNFFGVYKMFIKTIAHTGCSFFSFSILVP